MKENDPAAYAQLMQRVNELQAEEARAKQEQLEALRLAEERERLKRRRIENAVICTGLPIPSDLSMNVLLAVRAWDVDGYGRLHGVGNGSHYQWKEFNVADVVPLEHNTHGFYSVKLDSHGIIFGGISNYISRSRCCGLISLSGKVIEHDDGVMRAECATIKCVWYTGEASDVYFDAPMLMKNYPTTPVFVCTQRQVADALIMVVNLRNLRGVQHV
jgi:hypothetical protein